MNSFEQQALDQYLTQGPQEQECKVWRDDEPVITDSYGDRIEDEDAVFELTFILYEPDFELGEIVSQEMTKIVTQLNIADCIEENESKSLKHIEFVGFGKQYKEMGKSK